MAPFTKAAGRTMFKGLGRMTYTNGDIYVGEWSDDSPNGVGMLIHTNGKVDAGSWSYGKMMSGQSYGYATDQSLLAVRELSLPEPSALAYASADCTDGDCLYGKGKRVYKGGATYEGEFKDGVEDGFGTMTYGDGTKVKSNWKQGYNFGVARYDYGDGTMALAEFKGGTPNGCVLVMKSGNMVVQYYEDGVYLRQVNPTYSPGSSVMNGDLSNNAPSSGSSIEVSQITVKHIHSSKRNSKAMPNQIDHTDALLFRFCLEQSAGQLRR